MRGIRPLIVFILAALPAVHAATISLTDNDFTSPPQPAPANYEQATDPAATAESSPADQKALSESLTPIQLMVDFVNDRALRGAIPGGPGAFLQDVDEEEYEKANQKLIDALPKGAPKERYAPAYCALAMLCQKTRRVDVGLKSLEKAAELRPDDPLIPTLQAWFALDSGDYAKAAQSLSRARELDPYFTLTRIQQARIFTHQRDRERALEEWRKVQRAAPDYPHVADEIARLEMEDFVSEHSRLYSTAHFQVEYENSIESAGRETVQKILSDVDAARAILEKAFRFQPEEQTPLLVYGDKTFLQFFGQDAILGSFHPYDGLIRLRFFDGTPPPGVNFSATVYHEYAHALLHGLSHGHLTERWLHEGMAVWAEQFSGFDPLRIISPADRQALAQTLPPFEMMDMWDYGNYLRARIIVDESMRLFGQDRFIGVFAAMASGKDLDEALKAQLGLDYVSYTKLIRKRLR